MLNDTQEQRTNTVWTTKAMQEQEITRARFIKYSKRLTRNIAMSEPEYVNCDQLCILLGSALFLLPPLIYRALSLESRCGSGRRRVSDLFPG